MAQEDIIELTDIIKKGKVPVRSVAPAASGLEEPPLPDDFIAASASESPPVPDFGADLDALLKNYDNPGVPSADPTAAPTVAAAPQVASPDEVEPTSISDQNDSGQMINPNEELDLPPLSDLDALLEELGVDDMPIAAPKAAGVPLSDDLDAIPASGAATSVQAAKAASAVTPASEPDDDEGIDLNELDALLDSVLAVAPKPAAAPVAPFRTASRDDTKVETLQGEITSLKAEIADLRGNMDKYAAAAAARVIREEIAIIAENLE